MPHPTPKYKLDTTPEKYLELWQHFANRGDAYKDRLWNIIIWLYALLAGILGYMMSNFMGYRLNKDLEATETDPKTLILEPELSALFACFALLFCVYIVITIREYGEHIQHNWNRASYVLEQIEGLADIWYAGLDKKEIERRKKEREQSLAGKNWLQALPTIPQRLIYLTAGFALIFLLILVFSVYEWIW